MARRPAALTGSARPVHQSLVDPLLEGVVQCKLGMPLQADDPFGASRSVSLNGFDNTAGARGGDSDTRAELTNRLAVQADDLR